MHQFRRTVLADRAKAPEGRLEWLCGTAERYAPFYMLAGAPGYTTGAGNICLHLTLAMHAALTAGEWTEGLRLQQQILPIEDYRAREADSFNISMLKAGMSILGKDFGRPRAPQRQVTGKERDEIAALLKPIVAAEEELAHEMAVVGLTL